MTGAAPKLYVIHENPDWYAPLAAAFDHAACSMSSGCLARLANQSRACLRCARTSATR